MFYAIFNIIIVVLVVLGAISIFTYPDYTTLLWSLAAGHAAGTALTELINE